MKKIHTSILFVILLLTVCFFYKYHEIVFKKPQSIHKWRQSDCASIALNYYQNGMHFFSPETNNLTSDGGTSGKCCTSEVPILYYTVACLYKLFGHEDHIYRTFNTLIFLCGLIFLYRLFQYVLKDTFWAIALTLLFFTSPVLVYYGNNFLTNSSALAFSIIAWYYFIRYIFESKQKWFYLAIICFFIAGAFKVTALFSLVAILVIYILEILKTGKFNEDSKRIVTPEKRFIIPIICVFILIGAWILYASSYNKRHDCAYFSTTVFPIWSLKANEIKEVAINIRDTKLNQYFHFSVLLFTACCFIFLVICFKRNHKFLFYCIVIIFIEEIVYVLFEFWALSDHDYYTIEMYILPILILISTFGILKKYYPKITTSLISKLAFSGFLLYNIYYAQSKTDERYNGWMSDYDQTKDLYTVTPYLRQIGITPNDTVISIPDVSHVSLYLMNQKGWTEYLDSHFNIGTPTPYNHDSIGIQRSINKGAKYLILYGDGQLYSKPYLQSFCKVLIGRYRNISIFRLKPEMLNYPLGQIKNKFTCDAETVTQDRQYFINKSDNTLFEFGTTQTDTTAHSGKYACKLEKDKPYGMTIRCKDLRYGESISISVWKKTSTKAKGQLIVSAKNYYNCEDQVSERDANGWQKICKKIFISGDMLYKELTIYLYNPEKEPVYFDDLEITRYSGENK